jgi:hypothetical protein
MNQAATKMKTQTRGDKMRKALPNNRAPAKVIPLPVATNMLQVLANAARDPTIDVKKMGEIAALVERVEMRQAEERFSHALALAQSEMPRVVRDKPNTSTNSKYATLQNISSKVDPVAHKHGFSMSFGTAESNLADHYRVTGVLSLGMCSRNYQIDVPSDSMGMKGNPTKTKTHGMASAITYGRRILKTNMFDIAIVDHDDDGNAAGGLTNISAEQLEVLRELMTETDTQDEPFCKAFSIDRVENLPASEYKNAITKLNTKKRRMTDGKEAKTEATAGTKQGD